MLRAEWERAAATVSITRTASVTDLKAGYDQPFDLAAWSS